MPGLGELFQIITKNVSFGISDNNRLQKLRILSTRRAAINLVKTRTATRALL